MKDLEEKVEVTLARFDRAVKESSIGSEQLGRKKRTQLRLSAGQPENIGNLIAVEAGDGQASGESRLFLCSLLTPLAILACDKRSGYAIRQLLVPCKPTTQSCKI